MNITFFIGNGFDIGMGINSKFKDFYPIYQAQSLEKEDRIRMLSENIKSDYDTWSDFETALGKYTSKFDIDNKQDFIDQAKDFERDFVDYLKVQEGMLSFSNTKEISNTIVKALTQYYYNGNLPVESANVFSKIYTSHNRENHNYYFINFNYTQTLKKCISTLENNIVSKRKYGNSAECVDRIIKIVDIHGQIGLNPIIGVNDTEQIENKALAKDRRFTRYIVKPTLNQLLRNGNDAAAEEVIAQSNIICIYGMSLGATDKKWWNAILAWLSKSTERQLVFFDYDKNYSNADQFGRLEKEDSLIDKLVKYNISNNVDVEALRPRIHIAINKNIFEMDLAKEQRELYDRAIEALIAKV